MANPGDDLKPFGIKPPLDLIPMWALGGTARVYEFGEAKYEPGNWIRAEKDGEKALKKYTGAALRHLGAMQEHGWAALDDESGLPHVFHLSCSVQMLLGIGIKQGVFPRDPGRGNEIVSP